MKFDNPLGFDMFIAMNRLYETVGDFGEIHVRQHDFGYTIRLSKYWTDAKERTNYEFTVLFGEMTRGNADALGQRFTQALQELKESQPSAGGGDV